MATVPLATIDIFKMLVINKVLARDVIFDDMITDPKGIGHLNIEDKESIKTSCSGYAKRTPSVGRFTVTQVKQKVLT